MFVGVYVETKSPYPVITTNWSSHENWLVKREETLLEEKNIYIISDVLSSMVTHTWNWCSAFNPSKCTHTAVSSEQTHTHTVNVHPEQWAAISPAPGEQLGVRCLAQGHLSHGIEGGESAVHSQSPPSIPVGARIEPATFRLQAQLSNHWATTSPTRLTWFKMVLAGFIWSVIFVKKPDQLKSAKNGLKMTRLGDQTNVFLVLIGLNWSPILAELVKRAQNPFKTS